MLTLYGTSKSRSARSLWALEELGVKYEHVPVEVPKAKSPEHLQRNPNGHIPVLDDDGHRIWESMAINLYLAEKYGKAPFWPTNAAGHGDCYKWSFFGMTEVEPHLMTLLMQRVFLPADQRDEKAAQKATDSLKAPLKVLDDQLKNHAHLLGSDFTVADLNVAAVLSFAMLAKLDMSATPAAQAWLQKSLGREANARVRKLP
ncbi:MAG TPA: glutathione S-transferase family protein [Candidatus Binataceae bacterium]|nr:glutathione S-transferase family protein [Candidatus Binataceae bacterium]